MSLKNTLFKEMFRLSSAAAQHKLGCWTQPNPTHQNWKISTQPIDNSGTFFVNHIWRTCWWLVWKDDNRCCSWHIVLVDNNTHRPLKDDVDYLKNSCLFSSLQVGKLCKNSSQWNQVCFESFEFLSASLLHTSRRNRRYKYFATTFFLLDIMVLLFLTVYNSTTSRSIHPLLQGSPMCPM